MAKPLIAVDVDDVLAASTESLRHVVNQTYDVNLSSEHYKVPGEYWGYYERVWQTHGIHEKVSLTELNGQMEHDQSHVPVQVGAQAVLRELANKYDLVILTARDPSWRQATERWLDLHFPNTFSGIHFAGGHHDPEQKSKGDVCIQIGANWLIDDNIGHLQTAIDKGVGAVLFGDYGWHVDVPAELVHCRTWKQVGAYFAK